MKKGVRDIPASSTYEITDFTLEGVKEIIMNFSLVTQATTHPIVRLKSDRKAIPYHPT